MTVLDHPLAPVAALASAPAGPELTAAASASPAAPDSDELEPEARRVPHAVPRRRLGDARPELRRRLLEETGASTAEYAITVLAACGFAAVLVVLLKSGEVRDLLMGIITSALSLGS